MLGFKKHTLYKHVYTKDISPEELANVGHFHGMSMLMGNHSIITHFEVKKGDKVLVNEDGERVLPQFTEKVIDYTYVSFFNIPFTSKYFDNKVWYPLKYKLRVPMFKKKYWKLKEKIGKFISHPVFNLSLNILIYFYFIGLFFLTKRDIYIFAVILSLYPIYTSVKKVIERRQNEHN